MSLNTDFNRKAKKAGAGPRAPAVSMPSTVPELVSLAQIRIQECQPDAAILLYKEALRLEPNNTYIMDALGEVLYEVGEEDECKAVLQRSVELDGSGSYSKFLFLGQLTEGLEAVEFYRQGISLIRLRLSSPELVLDEIEQSTLRRELSNAFCSIAEIYMTDNCYDDDAEAVASSSAKQAVEADDSNPEAYALSSSVLLSQSRNDEAKVTLARACDLIEAIEDLEQEDAEGLPVHVSRHDRLFGLPTFSSRFAIAKMCLEVELWQQAADMLDRLLGEDDTVMEAWFLCGEAHLHAGNIGDAWETVVTAYNMVSSAIEALEMSKGKRRGASGAKASSVVAAASKASPIDFTFDSIQVLMDTPLEELGIQRQQFSKLLEVIEGKKKELGDEPSRGEQNQTEDDVEM